MLLYQRIRPLSGVQIGEPGPLPPELVGLDDESLADLNWVDPALGYRNFGFSPVVIPDPLPRAQLPKSIVTARVTALGKAADVWALLNANPAMAFKWFSPDWPNVFCDDATLLQALTAVGLSGDQIAGVVAA